MPRIDPITGCEVMTEAEFWNAEGAREGKSGAEMRERFYDELDDENEGARLRLMERWNALEFLISCADEDVEKPVDVLEVLSCNYNSKPRGTTIQMRARCEKADGSQGIGIGTYSWWPSSRLEPEDMDYEFYWEE